MSTTELHYSLDKNIIKITAAFTEDTNYISRKFEFSKDSPAIGLFCYDGMVDTARILEHIIECLHEDRKLYENKIKANENWPKILSDEILNIAKYGTLDNYDAVINAIILGQTVLLLDGSKKALILDTTMYVVRSIGTPEVETTISGSKEAFTEDIKTNVILMRRKIKTPSLVVKRYVIGTYSQTEVRVLYIKDLVKQEILDDLANKMKEIKVDHIFDTKMIGQLLDNNPLNIIPQHRVSERPDVTVTSLMEGRIAILCDGFPTALIIPYFASQELKTVDDYSENPILGTFYRLTRYIGVILATLLTSIYLCFIAYNHSVVPPSLALHISTGRQNIPFPSYVEILLMTFSIDLLRETGMRLPKSLGSTVSLLGAIVIGQAAVQAGYISASLIIIVAVSGFSAFLIPSITLSQATRMINYTLITLSIFLGLFGLLTGIIVFTWIFVNNFSLTIPLSYPFGTGRISDLKNSFIREPMRQMTDKPDILRSKEY